MQIENGVSVSHVLSSCEVNDNAILLSCLLKKILREGCTISPLLDASQVSQSIDALPSPSPSPSPLREVVASTLTNLHEDSREIVRIVLLYAVEVSKHSEVNHMNQHNLAVVLAPSLLPAQPHHEQDVSRLMQKQLNCTRFVMEAMQYINTEH